MSRALGRSGPLPMSPACPCRISLGWHGGDWWARGPPGDGVVLLGGAGTAGIGEACGSRCSTDVVTRGCLCSASAGAMLPYHRESPVLPRCPVRAGRVVHGPQFAYCPSPQGRCPQSPRPPPLPHPAMLSSASGQILAQVVPGSPVWEDGAVTPLSPLPSPAPAAGCPLLPLHRGSGALP